MLIVNSKKAYQHFTVYVDIIYSMCYVIEAIQNWPPYSV